MFDLALSAQFVPRHLDLFPETTSPCARIHSYPINKTTLCQNKGRQSKGLPASDNQSHSAREISSFSSPARSARTGQQATQPWPFADSSGAFAHCPPPGFKPAWSINDQRAVVAKTNTASPTHGKVVIHQRFVPNKSPGARRLATADGFRPAIAGRYNTIPSSPKFPHARAAAPSFAHLRAHKHKSRLICPVFYCFFFYHVHGHSYALAAIARQERRGPSLALQMEKILRRRQ